MCHRILIVDDRAEVADTLGRGLAGEWNVSTAQTAGDAMAVLDREDVSVALVDLQLGTAEHDGLTLLRAIRARHPNVVRLLFSGESVGPVLLHALNSGDAWRFLPKPYESKGLLVGTIREACQRHEKLDLAHAIERTRKEGEERGMALNGRLDRTDGRLDAISKNVEVLSSQVKSHRNRIAEAEAALGRVEDAHSNPGVDITAAMLAHAESLGEHGEQIGTVMGATATLREEMVALKAELQGATPKGSVPPTLATTEAKVDRMKAAMAVGGAAIGVGEVVAEVLKHVLK